MTDLELAKLCRDAYQESTWTTPGDTQCLLRMMGECAVIAFRGTEFDFEDIIRDIRAAPWRDPDLGWCHSGFLKGAREMWPNIAELVMRPGLPVVLTGHSLGGALAYITAGLMMRIYHRDNYPHALYGKTPHQIVTFGSPRPAYSQLANSLTDPLSQISLTRYVHGNDCVPSHPWPVWGFRHVGKPTKLAGSKTKNDRFLDHKMSAYLAALS